MLTESVAPRSSRRLNPIAQPQGVQNFAFLERLRGFVWCVDGRRLSCRNLAQEEKEGDAVS